MNRRTVIFDTDIGTDVDDAMALALLMGRPDIELLGVTTVYGDTVLRARLAQRYARLAGRRLDIHAGLQQTMSGREVWWPGHERSLHEDLESESFAGTDAVEYLIDTVRSRPGEIDLLAVGPLTNVAAAIDADPQFGSDLRALWVMGGHFGPGETEHNFRSDTVAANRVFSSGIPTVVAGLEVTKPIKLGDPEVERLAAAGPLGVALARDIDQWRRFWDEPWNVPHDPVAVLSIVEPDMFEFSEPGRIQITESSEDDEGTSVLVIDPAGSSRIVARLDAPAVTEAMLSGICRAAAPAR